ncbi:MAG: response regulator [Fimbriimonadaceae bacterium]|nr:response regulator [Fimbriimonadaceae bacterium]
MSSDPILLVEDNPDDIELTLIGFQRSRIANPVVVARDGQEALDYLFGTGEWADKDPQPLPVLIILDLNLPRIPGLDVLKELRQNERTKWVPCVILTTSVEESDLIASYSLGVNAYVQKPVTFEDFQEAAGRLGLFWLLMNVPPPTPLRLSDSKP